MLAQHPSVARVAVVALADERTGERACACVVVAQGVPTPTLEDLTAFCFERGLAKRRLPEQLALFEGLPLTPQGKVDKRALRDRFAAGPWPTPNRS